MMEAQRAGGTWAVVVREVEGWVAVGTEEAATEAGGMAAVGVAVVAAVEEQGVEVA